MDIQKHFQNKNSLIDAVFGSVDGALKEDKRKDALLSIEMKQRENNESRAMSQLMSSQKINNIPTQLKDGDLDQKTVVHNNFNNYDHSCEKIIRSFPQARGLKVVDISGIMSSEMFDGSNDVT